MDSASPRVLVIDDSHSDRIVTTRILLSHNVQVTPVKGPREASELLDAGHDVKLILTNYNMLDMTGYDLLRRVKKSPDLVHIPVVVVFAKGDNPDDIKRCLDAGAADYIFKPLDFSDAPQMLNYI